MQHFATFVFALGWLCLLVRSTPIHHDTTTAESSNTGANHGWSTDGRPVAFDWKLIQENRKFGQRSEAYSSLASGFLRGISMLQFAGATQYFVTETYRLDNTTVQTATALPLNLCLSFPGDTNYVMYVSGMSTATEITVTENIYSDSTCTTFVAGVPITYPVMTSRKVYQQCSHGNDDDFNQEAAVMVMNSLVSSKYPFQNSGQGEVVSSYNGATNCANQVALVQIYRPGFSCATSVANSFCSPVNESIIVDSSNSYTITTYTDKTCETKETATQVTLYDNTCYPVTSDDDQATVYYYTTVFQGGSSDDDDNVSLSQSTYGGLIAAVFIALVFGIACTAGLLCFGIIPIKGVTGKGSMSSNQQL